MQSPKHQLTFLGATSYIVGTIVGSGIFISPKGILRHAGSVGLSLIIWVLCALVAMVSALNYIELGTSIPESGSEFAYLTFVGWTPVAFSFLWLAALIQSSGIGAALILTFGKYMAEAISTVICVPEHLKYIFVRLFGIGLLCLLTLVNFYPLDRYASKLQVVPMVSKVTALLLITAVGAFSIASGHYENLTPPLLFNGTNWSASKIVSAMYQGNWAYGGFNSMNYGTEEIDSQNLSKILPRAVTAGIIIPTIVYLCANVAYFSVLSPTEMLALNAVASTFIEKTLGLQVAFVMPALVGFLLIGTLNGHLFIWSRFMMAGAKKGMMPTALGAIHPEYRSPRVALFIHALLVTLFSFLGDVEVLVAWLAVIGLLFAIFAICSLIVIKWSNITVSPKAVKFPIAWPFLSLSVTIVMFITPIMDDPFAASIGMILFVGAIGAYYALFFIKSEATFLKKVDERTTKICQLLFSVVVDVRQDSRQYPKIHLRNGVESKC